MYLNRESKALKGRKTLTDKYDKPPFWAASVGLQGRERSVNPLMHTIPPAGSTQDMGVGSQ
jgi:hypothetical protein